MRSFVATFLVSLSLFSGTARSARDCAKFLKLTLRAGQSELAQSKAYAKYLRGKILEWDQAASTKGTFHLDEDAKSTLDTLVSIPLRVTDAKGGWVDSDRFTSLEVDFDRARISIEIRADGRSPQSTFVVEGAEAKQAQARLRQQLDNILEDTGTDVDSLDHFSPAQLRSLLTAAKRNLRRPVSELARDGKFFHVTRNAETMKCLLEDGFRAGSGDSGRGVYAVTREYISALQSWAKRADWSTSPARYTVELSVDLRAIIADIASPEGKRAFEAFLRLNPKVDGPYEAYAGYMEADGLLYGWESGHMPAIVIKNLDKIPKSGLRKYTR